MNFFMGKDLNVNFNIKIEVKQFLRG